GVFRHASAGHPPVLAPGAAGGALSGGAPSRRVRRHGRPIVSALRRTGCVVTSTGNALHPPRFPRRPRSSALMPNIRILTLMLAGVAMLGPFSIDTYLPAFEMIAADFGVEDVLMQHTLSVYLLSFAFMSLFWGTLSDSFGRRPVIIASLLLFGIGSVGSALAPSYGWLLFFR